MKLLFVLAIFSYSVISYACPQLQGRYNKCSSELKKFNGEYIVDQHQENDYDVFNVEFNDDVTGEHHSDIIKTDNQSDLKTEKITKFGITTKVDLQTHCEGDKVVSTANVYFLGMRSGSFILKFYRDGKFIKGDVDGSYLGTYVNNHFVCELE